MSQTLTESKLTPVQAGRHDLFAAVRPGGFLGKCLQAIDSPRRSRWRSYLRACRQIPKSSPVHGSTNYKKLNERRCDLIEAMFAGGKRRYQEISQSPEYLALKEATSAAIRGQIVARNFLMARLLRRMKAGQPISLNNA